MKSTNKVSNPKKSAKGLYIASAVLIVGAVAVILLVTHSKNSYVEEQIGLRKSEIDAGPHVRIGSVIHSADQSALTLEGDAMPYASTILYAKIGGYLHDIKVDKGDHVKEGQILATIQSPETDRQYLAALADAKNKEKIAQTNRELLKKGLVAELASEQSDADAEVSKQNVAMLEVQKSYETIKAPFSGTVTARYADPGALIQNAVNQETTTLPLVSISQVDRLRINIFLDQRYASFVHIGDAVEVTVPERPGYVVNATVTRFSDQLDPQTRMRLIEIEVPNADGKIVAWSTVNVSLKVKVPVQLEIPTAALIVRRSKFFVPVLDSENKIEFHEVHIGDNNGQTVKIIDGLNGDEKVALNLSSSVVEGSRVQPVAIEAKVKL
jgi:membrane fusion protein (multidrug efflux system)